jgi:hypothetical protein
MVERIALGAASVSKTLRRLATLCSSSVDPNDFQLATELCNCVLDIIASGMSTEARSNLAVENSEDTGVRDVGGSSAPIISLHQKMEAVSSEGVKELDTIRMQVHDALMRSTQILSDSQNAVRCALPEALIASVHPIPQNSRDFLMR